MPNATARFQNFAKEAAALELEEACAREAIHLPGAVQPHGALLVLSAEAGAVAAGPILQASVNVASLLGASRDPLEAPCTLADALGDLGRRLAEELEQWLAADDQLPFTRTLTLGDGEPVATHAHRMNDLLILEIEPIGANPVSSDDLAPDLQTALAELNNARSLEELFDRCARRVRALTGFDRVLIYQFDADANGTVVAEDRNDRLPSYLDLRFPASDIPRQARELYRLNRLRLIPDSAYQPAPIRSAPGIEGRAPLDLSHSTLRSVSGVHLEYMRNMGTAASMSISILVDGALWGLISCHHLEPRWAPPSVRRACDFLGQIFAMQIASRLRAQETAERLRLKSHQSRLIADIANAQQKYPEGLRRSPIDWLGVTNAEGAAISQAGDVVEVGASPGPAAVRAIVAWLQRQGSPEIFASDRFSLPELTDEAQGLACGLLAVATSRLHADYVLWFRPEVVRTVRWGGEPTKQMDGDARLHPRRSFSLWREQVRGRARPWGEAEIESAQELRSAILSIVLRRAEEMAVLAGELQRSNEELESFAYSVSHDLRAPFRHIVGYAELLGEREEALDDKSRHYLHNIADAARMAGRLVDDLLKFSQMGRAALNSKPVAMHELVANARRTLETDCAGRVVEWEIGPLPSVLGDAAMLRQVWLNLLDNAVKYTRLRPVARIQVQGAIKGGFAHFEVRDNGVGFDVSYRDKLFGVFQRLHRMEDFEGTGIGLAIVKRIVDRHGGQVFADSKLGEGATFAFTIPVLEGEQNA